MIERQRLPGSWATGEMDVVPFDGDDRSRLRDLRNLGLGGTLSEHQQWHGEWSATDCANLLRLATKHCWVVQPKAMQMSVYLTLWAAAERVGLRRDGMDRSGLNPESILGLSIMYSLYMAEAIVLEASRR